MHSYLTFEEVRQTPEFARYYEAAGHFCVFLEGNQCLTTIELLDVTRTHLLRLYIAALAMPWVDLQSNKEYEEKLSADAFQTVLFTVAEQLGDARYYWHVFDPTNDPDITPVCSDLLDNVGDIYKDLKYSTMIFNLGEEDCEENALWSLKFNFEAHWGQHCVNALYAIHFYFNKLRQAE